MPTFSSLLPLLPSLPVLPTRVPPSGFTRPVVVLVVPYSSLVAQVLMTVANLDLRQLYLTQTWRRG